MSSSDDLKTAGPVLDLSQPHVCAFDAKADWPCALCRNNDPAGCDLYSQHGALYGWSDSNGRYERLGTPGSVLRKRYLTRIRARETDIRTAIGD